MIDLKNTYIKNDQGESLKTYLIEAEAQGYKWYEEVSATNFNPMQAFVAINGYGAIVQTEEKPSHSNELTLEDFKKSEREDGELEALKDIAQMFGRSYGVDVGYEDLPELALCSMEKLKNKVDWLNNSNGALTDEMNKIATAFGATIGEDVSYQYLSEFIVNKLKKSEPKTKTRTEWEQVPCTDAAHWFKQNETLYCAPSDELTPYESIQDYINRLADGDFSVLYRKVEKEINWQDSAIEFIDKAKELSRTDDLETIITGIDFEQERAEFIQLCKLVSEAVND